MLSRNHLSFALSLCRDGRGRPPFVVAGSKETRNEFRRFMAAFPDRYDYAKAQVRGVKNLNEYVIVTQLITRPHNHILTITSQ